MTKELANTPPSTEVASNEVVGEPATLGTLLRKAREDVQMTLRAVEEATNKEISNGYLSQLEKGKITKPSPHTLHTLSTVLSVDYEKLMERAGYIVPGKSQTSGAKHGSAATFAIDNLSADEESELLEFLSFIRQKKK